MITSSSLFLQSRVTTPSAEPASGQAKTPSGNESSDSFSDILQQQGGGASPSSPLPDLSAQAPASPVKKFAVVATEAETTTSAEETPATATVTTPTLFLSPLGMAIFADPAPTAPTTVTATTLPARPVVAAQVPAPSGENSATTANATPQPSSATTLPAGSALSAMIVHATALISYAQKSTAALTPSTPAPTAATTTPPTTDSPAAATMTQNPVAADTGSADLSSLFARLSALTTGSNPTVTTTPAPKSPSTGVKTSAQNLPATTPSTSAPTGTVVPPLVSTNVTHKATTTATTSTKSGTSADKDPAQNPAPKVTSTPDQTALQVQVTISGTAIPATVTPPPVTTTVPKPETVSAGKIVPASSPTTDLAPTRASTSASGTVPQPAAITTTATPPSVSAANSSASSQVVSSSATSLPGTSSPAAPVPTTPSPAPAIAPANTLTSTTTVPTPTSSSAQNVTVPAPVTPVPTASPTLTTNPTPTTTSTTSSATQTPAPVSPATVTSTPDLADMIARATYQTAPKPQAKEAGNSSTTISPDEQGNEIPDSTSATTTTGEVKKEKKSTSTSEEGSFLQDGAGATAATFSSNGAPESLLGLMGNFAAGQQVTTVNNPSNSSANDVTTGTSASAGIANVEKGKAMNADTNFPQLEILSGLGANSATTAQQAAPDMNILLGSNHDFADALKQVMHVASLSDPASTRTPMRVAIEIQTPPGAVVNVYVSKQNDQYRAQLSTNDPVALSWVQDQMSSLKSTDLGVNVRWLPPQTESSSNSLSTANTSTGQENNLGWDRGGQGQSSYQQPDERSQARRQFQDDDLAELAGVGANPFMETLTALGRAA